MYVQEKNVLYVELSTICSFRHPLGVLEFIPQRWRGTIVCLLSSFLSSPSLLPLPQYRVDNILHNNNDNYNNNYYYSSQHLYVCNRICCKVPNTDFSHSILAIPVWSNNYYDTINNNFLTSSQLHSPGPSIHFSNCYEIPLLKHHSRLVIFPHKKILKGLPFFAAVQLLVFKGLHGLVHHSTYSLTFYNSHVGT